MDRRSPGDPRWIDTCASNALADKGFDGLQLLLDNENQVVAAAVIFEDKATSNPRATIRDRVWPEFSTIERGGP